MSTHVVAFAAPDENWKKMKAVWDACKAAGIKAPHEVGQFFGWEEPDDEGFEMDARKLSSAGAVREWKSESQSGYELVIEKLPSHVKVVRFYNAW